MKLTIHLHEFIINSRKIRFLFLIPYFLYDSIAATSNLANQLEDPSSIPARNIYKKVEILSDNKTNNLFKIKSVLGNVRRIGLRGFTGPGGGHFETSCFFEQTQSSTGSATSAAAASF